MSTQNRRPAKAAKSKNVKMAALSAINQDDAYGQDARADFIAAAGQLYPSAKLQADLFPKFGARR